MSLMACVCPFVLSLHLQNNLTSYQSIIIKFGEGGILTHWQKEQMIRFLG